MLMQVIQNEKSFFSVNEKMLVLFSALLPSSHHSTEPGVLFCSVI